MHDQSGKIPGLIANGIADRRQIGAGLLKVVQCDLKFVHRVICFDELRLTALPVVTDAAPNPVLGAGPVEPPEPPFAGQWTVDLGQAREFGLEMIPKTSADNISSLRFDDPAIEKYLTEVVGFRLVAKQGLSSFFSISRVLHPAFASPEQPRFDARINDLARRLGHKTTHT